MLVTRLAQGPGGEIVVALKARLQSLQQLCSQFVSRLEHMLS